MPQARALSILGTVPSHGCDQAVARQRSPVSRYLAVAAGRHHVGCGAPERPPLIRHVTSLAWW